MWKLIDVTRRVLIRFNNINVAEHTRKRLNATGLHLILVRA